MIPINLENKFHLILLVLFFLLNLVQWGLVAYKVKEKGIYRNLSKTTAYLTLKNGKQNNAISFKDDKFFIIWNILPFILITLFGIIQINWNSWMFDLSIIMKNDNVRISGEKTFESHLSTLHQFSENYLLMIILVIISLSFSFFQNIKQKRFIEKKNMLYWWDKRISKSIFTIRQIALFTNTYIIMSIAIYSFIIVFMLIFSIDSSISNNELDFLFFHSDGIGGFKVIQSLVIYLSLVFFVLVINSLISFIEHLNQGIEHITTDIIVLTLLITITWLSFKPATSINSYFDTKYQTLKIEKLKLVKELNHSKLETMNSDELIIWFSQNKNKIDLIRQIESFTNYSIMAKPLAYLALTFVIPLFIWLFPIIFNAYNKRGMISQNAQ